jgi:hypothetical protein
MAWSACDGATSGPPDAIGQDDGAASATDDTTRNVTTTTINARTSSTASTPPSSSPPSSSSPPTSRPTGSIGAAGSPTLTFPPAGLPLIDGSRLEVGADLLALRQVGPWLVAVAPPSRVVRIDPAGGARAELELEIGESRSGPPQLATGAGSVWALGGPFRDQLVEIDLDAMDVLDRITLDDDHSLVGGDTELWLTTRRGVRTFDPVERTLGEVIDLPVDPAGAAVDDDGALWIALPTAAQVAQVTTDGRLRLVDTQAGPQLVAVSEGVAWLTHPPTIEISRIDVTSGAVLSVTDVDVATDATIASTIRGFRLGPDDAWAFVRYDGSPHPPVLVRLDGDSGSVSGARSVTLEGNTWTRTDDALWMHDAGSGALWQVDVSGFADAPATDLGRDSAASNTTTTIATALTTDTATTTTTSVTEREVAAAFDRFLDADVDAAEIGIGHLAALRRALLDLLAAQEEGAARVASIDRSGDTATVVFDVVVSGGTVILPALELDFERSDDGAWIPTDDSTCAIAEGVGVACPFVDAPGG